MKKSLLAIVTLFLSIHLYSQDETEFTNHRFGLNFGFSSATGEFSESDGNNRASGFAGGGLDFYLSYEYQPIKNLAFTFQYGRSTYKFEGSKYSSELARTDGFDNISWFTSADPHAVRYTVIGLKGIIGTKVQGYFNPVLGIGAYTSPEIRVTATGPGGSLTQSIEETDPIGALIYGMNIGIDFVILELISFNVNGMILASEFEIEADLNTFDANRNPVKTKILADQPFDTFNFTMGLGFNF